MMKLSVATFIFYFIGVALGYPICPSYEVLAPCECYEESLQISCCLDSNDDIKEILDRGSQVIDNSTIFKVLYIRGGLTEIPAYSVQFLKFEKIEIQFNFDLTHISVDAFGDTLDVTNEISITYNGIRNDPPLENEFFDLLSKFIKAEKITIDYNKMSYIPEKAFSSPLPNLRTLSIRNGGFIGIRSRAFTGLTGLKTLDFTGTTIQSSDISEDAFDGLVPKLTVDFSLAGGIPYLDENVFKGLLDSVISLSIGGASCPIFCPIQTFECSDKIHWICADLMKYTAKLKGYYCHKGHGYTDIWDYCNKTFP